MIRYTILILSSIVILTSCNKTPEELPLLSCGQGTLASSIVEIDTLFQGQWQYVELGVYNNHQQYQVSTPSFPIFIQFDTTAAVIDSSTGDYLKYYTITNSDDSHFYRFQQQNGLLVLYPDQIASSDVNHILFCDNEFLLYTSDESFYQRYVKVQ